MGKDARPTEAADPTKCILVVLDVLCGLTQTEIHVGEGDLIHAAAVIIEAPFPATVTHVANRHFDPDRAGIDGVLKQFAKERELPVGIKLVAFSHEKLPWDHHCPTRSYVVRHTLPLGGSPELLPCGAAD